MPRWCDTPLVRWNRAWRRGAPPRSGRRSAGRARPSSRPSRHPGTCRRSCRSSSDDTTQVAPVDAITQARSPAPRPRPAEPPRADRPTSSGVPSAGVSTSSSGSPSSSSARSSALALYFDLAGPLGRGLELLFGWIVASARFAMPIALVVAGVSLVRKGQSSNPTRLVIGWGLVGLAAIAIAHVVNGPAAGRRPRRGVPVRRPARRGLGDAAGGAALTRSGPSSSPRCRHRRGPAHHPDLAADDGHAHRPGCRQCRPADGARRPPGPARPVVAEQRPRGPRRRGASTPRSCRASRAATAARPSTTRPTTSTTRPAAAARGSRADGARVPGGRRSPATAATVGSWTLPPMHVPHAHRRAGRQPSRGRGARQGAAGVARVAWRRHHGGRHDRRPTVTRFELELGRGVKVARVTSLQRDIAYAMAATDVRILAPIPGRSAIGVEVPNHDAPARRARRPARVARGRPGDAARCDVAIGKDIAGKAVFLDLATTPHLLIAGATGAGKSSGINCIITSLLMRTTPDQVRLILDRPQAGRDGPVQPPAAPAHAAGHEPEEGRQRARLGGQGDGAPLRPAVRGRLPRHRRLQRGVRPRRAREPATSRASTAATRCRRPATASTSGCRTSSSSSTSSTT